MKALDYLLEHDARRADWLPDEIDLSFASERWRRTCDLSHNVSHGF
jgi:hypothetical protein